MALWLKAFTALIEEQGSAPTIIYQYLHSGIQINYILKKSHPWNDPSFSLPSGYFVFLYRAYHQKTANVPEYYLLSLKNRPPLEAVLSGTGMQEVNYKPTGSNAWGGHVTSSLQMPSCLHQHPGQPEACTPGYTNWTIKVRCLPLHLFPTHLGWVGLLMAPSQRDGELHNEALDWNPDPTLTGLCLGAGMQLSW